MTTPLSAKSIRTAPPARTSMRPGASQSTRRADSVIAAQTSSRWLSSIRLMRASVVWPRRVKRAGVRPVGVMDAGCGVIAGTSTRASSPLAGRPSLRWIKGSVTQEGRPLGLPGRLVGFGEGVEVGGRGAGIVDPSAQGRAAVDDIDGELAEFVLVRKVAPEVVGRVEPA